MRQKPHALMNAIHQLAAASFVSAEIWAYLLGRVVDLSTLVEPGDDSPSYGICQGLPGIFSCRILHRAEAILYIGRHPSVAEKAQAVELNKAFDLFLLSCFFCGMPRSPPRAVLQPTAPAAT